MTSERTGEGRLGMRHARRGPRTVLHVAWAPFFSGAERAFLLLLQNLDLDRYRPFVVCAVAGEFTQCLADARIPHAVVPLVHTDRSKPGPWLAGVARMTRLAWRHHAALIHVNELPSFQTAGYAARLLRLPSVCHVRFPFGDQAARWMLKPGFTRAVFVSDALRREMVTGDEAFFGDRTEVVHDGVEIPALPSLAERTERRTALGLPVDVPLVLIAGQVSEVKGIWEFIGAAARLVAQGLAAHFVVLGDDLKGGGQIRRDAEARVKALGIAQQFTFLGFRKDAPSLISLFDIVAVPSHVEPLGNATLEAMAAGRPVVGSDVGGIPEMIVNGTTGLLTPSRDALRLADALGRLIKAPDLARSMGDAGRRRAESHFSVQAHVGRVQSIYDSLLGASEGASGRSQSDTSQQ